MQILPPDIQSQQNRKGSSDSKKPFDSQEFLPNKLESGTSEEFRLLGHFGSGHILAPWRCPVEEKQANGSLRFAGYSYSNNYDGFPDAARQTDWSKPDRPKIEGEFVKPKRALLALVWSYERERVEVLIAEQRSVKDGLVEILSDPDFSFDDDGIATFSFKVSKNGAGLDTVYSLLPKSKPATKAIKAAFDAVKDTAKMELYLEGKHPLLRPTEFSSETSEF